MPKIVNQQTKKTYSLKKLAKQRKKYVGTGDGGLLTQKNLNRNK